MASGDLLDVIGISDREAALEAKLEAKVGQMFFVAIFAASLLVTFLDRLKRRNG